MISPVWLALAAVGLIAIVHLVREARRQRLLQLRADWGIRSPRTHRMEEIAKSHRSRAASRDEPMALDDRTWDDLVLDEVFQRIDYTESTLGRFALYHRLRMAHTPESLRAFESLVTRLGVDAAARERAQLALGRLIDPQGYNLWWLARPDAVDVPVWYAAFPALAFVTLVLIPVVVVRPALLPALIGVSALNFVVHLATLGESRLSPRRSGRSRRSSPPGRRYGSFMVRTSIPSWRRFAGTRACCA